MKFSVTKEHRDFFRNRKWIECEGVLTDGQQIALREGVGEVFSRRLNKQYANATEDELFILGYDLWRGASAIKKTLLSKNLGEIASELIEKRPIRFGYDQYLPGGVDRAMQLGNAYAQILSLTPTLQEMSGIQGVLCGAIVCLKEGEALAQEPSEESVFPLKAGHMTFFSPDLPIPLSLLKDRPGYAYLMLTYVKSNAVYYLEPRDPHNHEFKKLGYNFGDKLNDTLNPLVT